MHGLLNRWDNRCQGMLSLWRANRRLSSNPLWEVRKDKDSNCLSMPIPLVDELGQGIEPSHPLDDRSLNYNRRGVPLGVPIAIQWHSVVLKWTPRFFSGDPHRTAGAGAW